MGEELECDREPENSCGRYAVAVKRSGSRVCSLFLRRGSVISYTGTGLEIGNYFLSSIDRTSTRLSRTYTITYTYTYVCKDTC